MQRNGVFVYYFYNNMILIIIIIITVHAHEVIPTIIITNETNIQTVWNTVPRDGVVLGQSNSITRRRVK